MGSLFRFGKCDQPGCKTPEGYYIAKVLPSSGRWCHTCNDRRLAQQKEAKPKKEKPASKSVIKALVNELDKIFSLYVRQHEATDDGMVTCVTCGKVEHWEDVDCGHCEERGNFAIRWDLRNVGPQCRYPCNRGDGKGEKKKFIAYIEKRYGAGTHAELKALTRANFHLDRNHLQELIKKFTL